MWQPKGDMAGQCWDILVNVSHENCREILCMYMNAIKMVYTAATNNNIPNCTHASQFPRNVALVSLTKVKCNTNSATVFQDRWDVHGSNLGNVAMWLLMIRIFL